MKKKSKYDDDLDMPIGKLIRVPDFLPPPDQLVMPDGTIKITLSLTKKSVDFFKAQARRNHTKYQKMMREVIDQYAKGYSKGA